jgi:hypothetical protein
MGKRIPNYRKEAIAKAEAKGIKTRKRRKDYTEKQWETHLIARKKKNNQDWYKKNGRKYYKEKLGYVRDYDTRKPVWYICDMCGNEFRKKPKGVRGKGDWQFCSMICTGKAFMQKGRDNEMLRRAKVRDEKAKFIYQIVYTDKYIQKISFGKFIEKSDAFEEIDKLLNDNKNVLLPRKYFYLNGEINPSNDEILLLKLDEDSEPSKFPNEYGKLIDNIVESKSNWVIVNKHKWNVEEKFHHIGVSKIKLFKSFGTENTIAKYRDKDIKYILDEIIFKYWDVSLEIFVYDCYLIMKNNYDDIELIYSPHVNIIIELYNYLKKICEKYEDITFIGMIDKSKKLCEFYDKVIKNKLESIYKIELEKENVSKKNKDNFKSTE